MGDDYARLFAAVCAKSWVVCHAGFVQLRGRVERPRGFDFDVGVGLGGVCSSGHVVDAQTAQRTTRRLGNGCAAHRACVLLSFVVRASEPIRCCKITCW